MLSSGFVMLLTSDEALSQDGAASKSVAPDSGPLDSVEKKNSEAAIKMTREAAQKYEFEIHGVDQLAVLREQPILRWSNPERGQVYGNVYLWTYRGRPAVVGSLFKWFSPFTYMSHRFDHP